MSKNYIYSTCPQDFAFAVYQQLADGSSHATRHILVKGGGSIPIQAGSGFHTPLGVVTEVSDEDLADLKKDWSFNHYVNQGFMRIDSKKVDVEKVAGDMNIDLPSTPASESDILDMGTTEGVEIKVYEEKPQTGRKPKN
jgi:hypothetical protein